MSIEEDFEVLRKTLLLGNVPARTMAAFDRIEAERAKLQRALEAISTIQLHTGSEPSLRQCGAIARAALAKGYRAPSEADATWL